MNNQPGAFNHYFLTLSSYILDPRYLDNPVIKLGTGVNLADPLKPEVAPYTPFEVEAPKAFGVENFGLPKSSEVIQEACTFRESLSVREETSVLSAYFKASYALSSMQGAATTAKTESETYHTAYALLEHTGEAESLPAQCRHWRENEVPISEKITDQDEALYNFLRCYGSHYISGITYGLRIAVQGKIKKTSVEKSQEFSLAFKAAFGSFGAEGGVRSQQKSKLEQMSVELLLEATSGGHGGGLMVLRGFDDIADFLEKVKNNEIQFTVAPLKVVLNSYWPTLNFDWKTTRSALDPRSAIFKVPEAQFGVPKGTILPWQPTAEFFRGLDNAAEITIVPPDGWAICDGTLGTPDLREKFIMGTAEFAKLATEGGSKTHNHGELTGAIDTRKVPSDWWWTLGTPKLHQVTDVRHQHTIQPSENLPPFTCLIMIMKL